MFPAISEALPRKRFTRQELQPIEDSAVLNGRYEPIEGDLIEKTGQRPPHADVLRLVYAWISACLKGTRIRNQSPIEVAGVDQIYSEPEPDIAVLREFLPDHRKHHPRGGELTLAVEVADSSSRFDLSTKAALYAAPQSPNIGFWT